MIKEVIWDIPQDVKERINPSEITLFFTPSAMVDRLFHAPCFQENILTAFVTEVTHLCVKTGSEQGIYAIPIR